MKKRIIIIVSILILITCIVILLKERNENTILKTQEYSEKAENSNITVEIKNVMMDDFNMRITLRFDGKDIEFNQIKGLLIFDEFENILYCDNNVNIGEKYRSPENMISNGAINYDRINIEENVVEYTYSFYSENFPKSKEIYVYIKEINSNIGEWKIKANIDEEYSERNNTNYSLLMKKDNIELIMAKASLTQMKIKIKFLNSIDINEYNKNNIKNNVEEIINRVQGIETTELINEYNESFVESRTNDGDAGIDYNYNDGTITYSCTIDIPQGKQTEKLIYVITTHNNEKINIELLRN